MGCGGGRAAGPTERDRAKPWWHSSPHTSASGDQHQIVAVDDLIIEGRAEGLAGLLGAEAADAAGVRGGVVCQPAGELAAGQVANADDVPLVELADDLDDADGKQAARSRFQR